MSTTSIVDGMRSGLHYFDRETTAKRSPAATVGVANAVSLGGAALSSLFAMVACFSDHPWFAAAGLLAAYAVFWISLPAKQSAE
jgi:hypothetical protein